MRIALLLVCLATSTARADTFSDRDTFGLDLSTVWEPANDNAFAAGPLFRFEEFTTKLPSWFGVVARTGMYLDNSMSISATVSAGLMIRPYDSGFYGTLEGGITLGAPDHMDEMIGHGLTGGASLGFRAGPWDVRASALAGTMYDGTVWLFSIGRDFVRFDSTITSTAL